jgi:sodium-coupled monocarboxylate transporter 8/12
LVSKETSQKTVSNILKLIVIATGAVCTSLVLIIEHLGGLLKLAISLGGITNGPLLAMFTMGMLFPKANSKVESGTYIAKSKNWEFFV